MAINPQIPLSGSQVNLRPGINQLIGSIQQGKRNEVIANQEQRAQDQSELQIQRLRQQLAQGDRLESFQNHADFLVQLQGALNSGNAELARSIALDHKSSLVERQKTDSTVNTIHTDEYIDLLGQDPSAALALANEEMQGLTRLGFIQGVGGDGINKSYAPVVLKNEETGEKMLVSPTIQKGTPILERFDIPEGFQVSMETPAEKRAADAIANLEKVTQKLEAELKLKPKIAAEVETAKKGVELEWDSKIAEKVKLAEAKAKERGEVLNDLSRMEATLPELQLSIAELRDLSGVATHTLAGRIFDAAVRETGFGATDGATARAKFIAIVNNQVLPLLRQTFGAAFTEKEGESLKATMGDPDSSPEEKMAQLDAFIAQKERDIRSKQRQLESMQETEDLSQMSDEELQAIVNGD